ncbi:ABC transporter permease [Zhihengliuella salsuginis]|uniref:Transport permease protein n=1 Tax=Zhihengliuella salsuginis TaxID=578222 RepID=A0ABQ3GK32_9MICC|nr:ABC transporter permease [Zhihengliuella salsuginis]GHD11813.1 transport permease protein [Zhihengliuella salsuginis]
MTEQVPASNRTQRIHVSPHDLVSIGARPGFFEYIRQIWQFRSFIHFDSRSRIATGNSDDALGRIWLVLNPILNGATYFFVFGILLDTAKNIPNFLGYLIIGTFMFRFTTGAITQGARALNNNQSMMRAFNFPRATLPLAVNVRELMSQVIVITTMLVLILAIPPLEEISWLWLLIFPVVIVQFLFNLGLSLLLCRIVTRFPDVVNLISFGTRIWLYLSCVFFSLDRFENNPGIYQAMQLNPLFCVLDITRDALLYGNVPSFERWAVLGTWTLVLLIVGSIAFWKAEESYNQERA